MPNSEFPRAVLGRAGRLSLEGTLIVEPEFRPALLQLRFRLWDADPTRQIAKDITPRELEELGPMTYSVTSAQPDEIEFQETIRVPPGWLEVLNEHPDARLGVEATLTLTKEWKNYPTLTQE